MGKKKKTKENYGSTVYYPPNNAQVHTTFVVEGQLGSAGDSIRASLVNAANNAVIPGAAAIVNGNHWAVTFAAVPAGTYILNVRERGAVNDSVTRNITVMNAAPALAVTGQGTTSDTAYVSGTASPPSAIIAAALIEAANPANVVEGTINTGPPNWRIDFANLAPETSYECFVEMQFGQEPSAVNGVDVNITTLSRSKKKKQGK